jgi:hypothetical protein
VAMRKMVPTGPAAQQFGDELPDVEGIVRLWVATWNLAKRDAKRGDDEAIEFLVETDATRKRGK